MKNYSEYQRINYAYVAAENPNTWEKWSAVYSFPQVICSCTRTIPGAFLASWPLWAYRDCQNCLGYGVMPIPPSELR